MPQPGDVSGLLNSVFSTDQGIAFSGFKVAYDNSGNPTLFEPGGILVDAGVATAVRLSQGEIEITFTLFASLGLNVTATNVFVLQYEGTNNRKVDITDTTTDGVLVYTTLANTGSSSPQDLDDTEFIHLICYIKYWGN